MTFKKICPKCGSTDVHIDFSNPAAIAYGTSANYECKSCSFSSNFFPEVKELDIEYFRKKLKK